MSQFRATYTTLLNLLDAYGSFAGVREIAERSFAYRDLAQQIHQLEKVSETPNKRLKKESRTQVLLCQFPLHLGWSVSLQRGPG